MLYSVARYRHHRPSPPFQLGGEYVRSGDRQALKDAQGLVLLDASTALFAGVVPGDLVVVTVTQVNEEGLHGEGFEVLTRTRRERPAAPKGGEASRFTQFVADVRAFFLGQGLYEVWTPTLVPCPGLEPSLEPFATEATWGERRRRLYLPTSPEIHLKKAMALGWSDIFEIKSTFRRGEFSPHHAAEFAMLEWYRGFADLELVLQDLSGLVKHLAARGWGEADEFTVTDFASLFAEHFAFQLRPETTADELRALCARLGIAISPNDHFGDLFHRLLVERLEDELARRGPVVVRRFPPSQAALARLDADGWADRFEFYWHGLEIANAFNEVTDPVEQERRWAAEQRERARLGTSDLPSDPELLRALEMGLPPSGGIALGVERLFMALTGTKDIRTLRLFSTQDLFNDFE